MGPYIYLTLEESLETISTSILNKFSAHKGVSKIFSSAKVL
jgi:hypothetical protein